MGMSFSHDVTYYPMAYGKKFVVTGDCKTLGCTDPHTLGGLTKTKRPARKFDTLWQAENAAREANGLLPETLCNDFVADITALGEANGKTAAEVYYQYWKPYSQASYDQSVLFSEFLVSCKRELPNRPSRFHLA